MSANLKNERFFDLYTAGDALAEEIEDFVHEWHKVQTDLPLYAYLGLKKDEYEIWVRFPDALPTILNSRKTGKSITNILMESDQELRCAARADSAKDLKVIRQWLQERKSR